MRPAGRTKMSDEKNQGRRRERVASLLKRAISETLLREFTDPRFKLGLVSVTRVEPSPDLRSAKVWISVMGTEGQQRTIWRALNVARARIQSLSADRTSLRHTPELIFKEDRSIKNSFAVSKAIDDAMVELHARTGEPLPDRLNPDAADDEVPDGHDGHDHDDGAPDEGVRTGDSGTGATGAGDAGKTDKAG